MHNDMLLACSAQYSTCVHICTVSTSVPALRARHDARAEVQRRAAPILNSGLDAVIISKTGSGKTFSFLAPMLAQLSYPPQTFPDDLKGPQVIRRSHTCWRWACQPSWTPHLTCISCGMRLTSARN